MDPDQTAPQRSSLIRVHNVCFHDKIKFEIFLDICSRCIKQTAFSGQKVFCRISVKQIIFVVPRDAIKLIIFVVLREAMIRTPNGSGCGRAMARLTTVPECSWGTRCYRTGFSVHSVTNGDRCTGKQTLHHSISKHTYVRKIKR